MTGRVEGRGDIEGVLTGGVRLEQLELALVNSRAIVVEGRG